MKNRDHSVALSVDTNASAEAKSMCFDFSFDAYAWKKQAGTFSAEAAALLQCCIAY